MSSLSDSSRWDSTDLETNSSETLDDISTGSYWKLPDVETVQNSSETMDKPVFNFTQTKTPALLSALRSFDDQMRNLESQLNQARNRNQHLMSQTDFYKKHSQNLAEKEATSESLVPLKDMRGSQYDAATMTSDVTVPRVCGSPSDSNGGTQPDKVFDISVGSYKKLPAVKSLISDHTPDKSAYTFSETNIEALMNGLKRFKQSVDNLESVHSHPGIYTKQLVTPTEHYKYHFQNKDKKVALLQTVTSPEDFVRLIARTKSRCILLKKTLEQMKQLILVAKRSKASLQRELKRQSNIGPFATHLLSLHKISLNEILGLEREILQLSVIQNVSEQRLRLVEQTLALERKQLEILLQRSSQSTTGNCGAPDINGPNMFASGNSCTNYLNSSANNRQLDVASTECNNLQELFIQLQREFCQMTWKHQNLTKLYNDTYESAIHADIEAEIDDLVSQMELKAKQMVKIRKVLYAPPKNETKVKITEPKQDTDSSLCKSKMASNVDSLKSSKSCRNIPQTVKNYSIKRTQQTPKATKKLEVTLRQDDLRWI
ncbi:uncharacterized protein LOC115227230 [Argonauta hians]